MDVLSHGLWGLVVGNAAARKFHCKPKNIWLFIWGVFPDVFAFGLPFVWMMWSLATGAVTVESFSAPRYHGPPVGFNPRIYEWSAMLYNWSHSLPVFLAVTAIIWFAYVRRHGSWSRMFLVLPWLAHMLMDIPTHSLEFYPTPIFWPLSDWKFNGIRWAQSWFMILNYSTLALAALWLRWSQRKKETRR